MALTFDDGPGVSTEAVLAVLRRHHVRGTFFVIGRRAAKRPDLVEEAAADGNLIANHSWSHPTAGGGFAALSPAAVAGQLDRTQTLLTAITGRTPCLFRAPQGRDRAPALTAAAALRRLTVVHWRMSSQDYAQPLHYVPAEVARIAGVLSGLWPHPILLMHDGAQYRGNTVAALDRIITWYASRGYAFTDPLGRPLPAPTARVLLTGPDSVVRQGAVVSLAGAAPATEAGAHVVLRSLVDGVWVQADQARVAADGSFTVSTVIRGNGITWCRVFVDGALSRQVPVVANGSYAAV